MSHDHSQNHYGPNASFDGHDSDLASAGMLIESLRQQLAAAYEAGKRDASEDLEQAAFEKWLHDKCPSGDVESVQRQWLKSYDYAELAGKLEQAAAGILIESLRQQLDTAWAQAHRLALELECLIMDTKDNVIVSKWWDSAFEAIEEYNKLKPGAAEDAEAWAKMRKAGI